MATEFPRTPLLGNLVNRGRGNPPSTRRKYLQGCSERSSTLSFTLSRYYYFMIADNAIYVDGRRAAQQPSSLQETYEVLHQLDEGVAWIDLYEPTQEEFESIAQELELPSRVIENAIKPQQRPKLVRYGHSLFVVLKTARYLDQPERVDFSEAHVLVGKDFVVTVRYEEIQALEEVEVRRRLEGEPELLRQGPLPILHEIMDQIVDDYEPVLEGLGTDIEEVEGEVFGGNARAS